MKYEVAVVEDMKYDSRGNERYFTALMDTELYVDSGDGSLWIREM